MQHNSGEGLRSSARDVPASECSQQALGELGVGPCPVGPSDETTDPANTLRGLWRTQLGQTRHVCCLELLRLGMICVTTQDS